MEVRKSQRSSKGKDVNDKYQEEGEDAKSTLNQVRRCGERNHQIDNDLSSIKIKMPHFQQN